MSGEQWGVKSEIVSQIQVNQVSVNWSQIKGDLALKLDFVVGKLVVNCEHIRTNFNLYFVN